MRVLLIALLAAISYAQTAPVIHYCVINAITGFHGAYVTADEAKAAMAGMSGSRAAYMVVDGIVTRDAHEVKDSNGVGQGGSGWTNWWGGWYDIYAMADVAEATTGCTDFNSDGENEVVNQQQDCDEYQLTFAATGCPNSQAETKWWRTQSNANVFEDMMSYCTRTRDGRADSRQRRMCCGEHGDCRRDLVCEKQTSFTPCTESPDEECVWQLRSPETYCKNNIAFLDLDESKNLMEPVECGRLALESDKCSNQIVYDGTKSYCKCVPAGESCVNRWAYRRTPPSGALLLQAHMQVWECYPPQEVVQQTDPTGFWKDVFDRHNLYRCMHEVPLLKWNSKLAASSQKYADYMVAQGYDSRDTWRHSSDNSFRDGFKLIGENIGHHSNGYDAHGLHLVDTWYGEIQHYPHTMPTKNIDIVHYTQMIWKSTREVGCGGKGPFLVCQYGESGNFNNIQNTPEVPHPNSKTAEECGGVHNRFMLPEATFESYSVLRDARSNPVFYLSTIGIFSTFHFIYNCYNAKNAEFTPIFDETI